MKLRCTECSAVFEPYPPRHKCPKCGGLLEYELEYEKLKEVKLSGLFNFWRYRKLLPEVKNVATMGEGGTPLHKAKRLSKKIGVKHVFLKDETRNPTNSFRDRSAALLVSNALDLKYKAVLCATNGNLGASLAAYCAKYGLICHIIVPKLVDMGKLAQMLIYDAIIEEYGEIVDESIERAEKIAKETGWYQATAELNPLVVEAQKTIAYEIAEQLGVPDWVIVSMGSGGTIYSLWKGFKELKKLGKTDFLPKMVGVQAKGCSPIINGFLEGKKHMRKSSTHALAILVKKPLQQKLAVKAIKESRGTAVSVSDQEIFAAEQEIAKLEGIFAEPASSATIAALKKLVNNGTIDKEESVACLITGSGLKATDVLQALTKKKKTIGIGLEISTKEKILRILSEKESYGYEIWKKLGKVMTRPAVYQHLNELEQHGLITSYIKTGRKFFKITKRGMRIMQAIEELKVLL
ncbi:threonine synthase [Candidatus Bathyarchaeota archaeon]|nr:threonine synthase [Candidatus Bathyarchaeota archaeon]